MIECRADKGWVADGLSLLLTWLHVQSDKSQTSVHSCEGFSSSDDLNHETTPYTGLQPLVTIQIRRCGRRKLYFPRMNVAC